MKRMNEKQMAKILARVESRREILEQSLQSVVQGFTHAMFVWGPPGLGKSHLLTTMLDVMADRGWVHHTAHSTPKAVFLSLLQSPHAIHLFEDCERVLKTDLTASILRAACGAPNDRTRLVTYHTAHEDLKCEFFGSIIVATNENLSRKNGPLQGVASRFRPIKWDMDLEERIATILHLAKQPAVRNEVALTAKECTKVALELIDMTSGSDASLDLDLRLFTEHALPAFAMSKKEPGTKWQDLLQAKLSGIARTRDDSQADKTRKLQLMAQKIHAECKSTKERLAKWKELTGLGQAIYFRHLKSGKAK